MVGITFRPKKEPEREYVVAWNGVNDGAGGDYLCCSGEFETRGAPRAKRAQRTRAVRDLVLSLLLEHPAGLLIEEIVFELDERPQVVHGVIQSFRVLGLIDGVTIEESIGQGPARKRYFLKREILAKARAMVNTGGNGHG